MQIRNRCSQAHCENASFRLHWCKSPYGSDRFLSDNLAVFAPSSEGVRESAGARVFVAARISLTATQLVAYELLMVMLHLVIGMAFVDAARGGNPLPYEQVYSQRPLPAGHAPACRR